MRIGHGYDVHKFSEERELILGGEHIPHHSGLLGHSDADVLLHAICDSLLGAAALGDIGKHFSPDDDRYLNISSLLLLQKVGQLVADKGFEIENIDATVIAQQPKLLPYTERMKQNVASALGISCDRINIKATTEEGLGFTGAKEGIAAHSVCLLK